MAATSTSTVTLATITHAAGAGVKNSASWPLCEACRTCAPASAPRTIPISMLICFDQGAVTSCSPGDIGQPGRRALAVQLGQIERVLVRIHGLPEPVMRE